MEVSFNQVHQKVLHTVKEQAKSRTVRAANAIKKYSNKVLNNSDGPAGRTYFHDGHYHTASAPGQAPALDSGTLRRSWKPLPYSEMVGGGDVYTPGIKTDVIYAPFLEHGTSKMAARPFEEKIKQESWPEVEQIYSQPYL